MFAEGHVFDAVLKLADETMLHEVQVRSEVQRITETETAIQGVRPLQNLVGLGGRDGLHVDGAIPDADDGAHELSLFIVDATPIAQDVDES